MDYFIFFLFGFAPSIIWLLFFLIRDVHPESKTMVLRIFFYGMISALVAGFLAMFLDLAVREAGFSEVISVILSSFLGAGFVEEMAKYLVVKEKVLSHHEFDEPIDAMLYMIISALGFAAFENVLIYLAQDTFLPAEETVIYAGFRFISATFLHALCSGLLGYFLALAISETKHRIKLILSGIFWATLLHGIYDFSIIIGKDSSRAIFIIIPGVLLIILALVVSSKFKKLEKMASVCKL